MVVIAAFERLSLSLPIFILIFRALTSGVSFSSKSSVALSDEFMRAVANGDMWDLKFPDYTCCKDIYDKLWTGNITDWESRGLPVLIYNSIPAKELYDKIMEHAWKTGEPGVSFIDAMDRGNPNPLFGHVKSTNPCAEFCSVPYNSCNLGSINLSKFVHDGIFDEEALRHTVAIGVRFLDDMITVNNLPLGKIDQTTKELRSVGLGTMGLADMLYEMKIPYDSVRAKKFVDQLYSTIYMAALDESKLLARQKGVYPAYKTSEWDNKHIRVRNSNFLSIAPNGSIGFISDTSCGIEPNFALVYHRRTATGEDYKVVNRVFLEALNAAGLDADKIIPLVERNNGSVRGLDAVPDEIQKVFVTAGDISPKSHLEIMAIIQRHVDLSVSKTINMPNDTTVEDVKDIYKLAWESKCKGITIYRDGSRENQTLSVKSSDNSSSNEKPVAEDKPTVHKGLGRGDIVKVDDDLLSMKRTIRNGCGKFYLHLDFDEVTGEPMESYINLTGNGCRSNLGLISRLISLSLRAGVPIEAIIDQCLSVDVCPAYMRRTTQYHDTSKGTSCGSAIGWALQELNSKIQDMCFDEFDEEDAGNPDTESVEKRCTSSSCSCEDYKESPIPTPQPIKPENLCPECGEPLTHEGGCITCPNCGWSKCS